MTGPHRSGSDHPLSHATPEADDSSAGLAHGAASGEVDSLAKAAGADGKPAAQPPGRTDACGAVSAEASGRGFMSGANGQGAVVADTSIDPREEITQHLASLRAFAVSLTRDSASADDLVQDAVVKAWKNIDRFQRGTNLRAWLFTILRNTFYSDRRKARREVSDTDGLLASQLAEKPRHDGALAFTDFMRAFSQLPDEQREALVLVGASGFTYEEVADTTGVAIGTVKSRVNRARARLAELLSLAPGEQIEMTDKATLSVLSAGNSTLPFAS